MIGSSQSSHCIGSKEELNSSGKYEIRVKVDDSVLTVSIAVTGRNSLWLEHQASQDFKVTFKSFFFFLILTTQLTGQWQSSVNHVLHSSSISIPSYLSKAKNLILRKNRPINTNRKGIW